jgi:hypothetical protein
LDVIEDPCPVCTAGMTKSTEVMTVKRIWRTPITITRTELKCSLCGHRESRTTECWTRKGDLRVKDTFQRPAGTELLEGQDLRKGRKLRQFPWEKIMRKQYWNAQELAPILGLHPTCTRRYLHIYWCVDRLDRQRFGMLLYYSPKRFLSPPDLSYPCPGCRARMEVYHVKKCGCEFHLCAVDPKHDLYKYCKHHQTVPVTASTASDHGEVKN